MDELDAVFNRVAAYFGLLSEPIRLKIVHSICLEDKSVTQIVAATGATQTNISRHLNRMYAAGALARRKKGTQVYYSVADPNLIELCRGVCVRIAAEIDGQQPLRRDLLKLIPPAAGRPPRSTRAASAKGGRKNG